VNWLEGVHSKLSPAHSYICDVTTSLCEPTYTVCAELFIDFVYKHIKLNLPCDQPCSLGHAHCTSNKQSPMSTRKIYMLHDADMVEYDGVMNDTVRRMKNACVRFSKLIPFSSEFSIDVEDTIWNEHIYNANTHDWDEDVYIIYESARKRLHSPRYLADQETLPDMHFFRNRSGGNNRNEIRARWHAATKDIYHHIFFLPTEKCTCDVACITGQQYSLDPLDDDLEGIGLLLEDEPYDSVANKITFSMEDGTFILVTVEKLCIGNEPKSHRHLNFGDVLEYLDENGNIILTIDTKLLEM